MACGFWANHLAGDPREGVRDLHRSFSRPNRRKEPTMTTGAIETFFQAGRWRNRIVTVHVLPTQYRTREEAAAAGRRLAWTAKVDHVVRDIDGTVIQRKPYDRDRPDSSG
jgi:hypothetical protein